jgi:hypothetical protein
MGVLGGRIGARNGNSELGMWVIDGVCVALATPVFCFASAQSNKQSDWVCILFSNAEFSPLFRLQNVQWQIVIMTFNCISNFLSPR